MLAAREATRNAEQFVENDNQRISRHHRPSGGRGDSTSYCCAGTGQYHDGRCGDRRYGTEATHRHGGVGRKTGYRHDGHRPIQRQHAERLESEEVLAEFSRFWRGRYRAPSTAVPAAVIERSLQSLAIHLAVGGFLVILVLYAFLFDWRTAFISAFAIPLSLVAALVTLLNLGVNLNIMILGGLAALGSRGRRHYRHRKHFPAPAESRRRANPRSVFRVIYERSMEVRSSVVYASFIVVLVFVPLLTLGALPGAYSRSVTPIFWRF